MQVFFILSVITLITLSCNRESKSDEIKKQLLDASRFDTVIAGKKVALYQIQNKNKLRASFTNYGARAVSLTVPDQSGRMRDIILGFSSIKEYLNTAQQYYGATIGRYGNRIASGSYSIDGVNYQGIRNNNGNMLHGGSKGFEQAIWDVEEIDAATLRFSYLSPDGEMGFPGNLNVKVTFKLTDDDALKISYEATTDKKTILNLTNHAFFNLNGAGNGTILNHKLQIFADEYTPVDATLIPTGEFQRLRNTPFDFIDLKAIGEKIDLKHEQLNNGKGYDHNFVLKSKQSLKHAARVIGDSSGIIMDVYTNEPGLQFYSGNFMKGNNVLRIGAKDGYRTAFCLETQHFPDSPNHENFPSTILKPGVKYLTTSMYQFSLRN